MCVTACIPTRILYWCVLPWLSHTTPWLSSFRAFFFSRLKAMQPPDSKLVHTLQHRFHVGLILTLVCVGVGTGFTISSKVYQLATPTHVQTFDAQAQRGVVQQRDRLAEAAVALRSLGVKDDTVVNFAFCHTVQSCLPQLDKAQLAQVSKVGQSSILW